jgi:hypothetical protein
LLWYFILTQRHAFDPAMTPMRLMRAVAAGLNVQLPGVKPELVELIKSMVSVNPEGRPDTARAVFETICENEFAFFEDVDAVAVRVELAKFGVEDKFEGEIAHLKRENIALKAKVDRLEARLQRVLKLLTADQLLELRAEEGEPEAQLELGEKLLVNDRARARELLRKCGLPKARELLAAPEFFAGSMAEPWAKQLKEWLPEMKSAKLLLKRAGRDAASVDAYIDAAKGFANVLYPICALSVMSRRSLLALVSRNLALEGPV